MDSWRPVSTVDAPAARFTHSAVWTGSEMIVWGGTDGSAKINTGGRYDPVSDTWVPTSTANAPPGRGSHSAIWASGEMMIYGGVGYQPGTGVSYFAGGGRYDPVADSWQPIPDCGPPRGGHWAVWTGESMIVWGGHSEGIYDMPGGRYTP